MTRDGGASPVVEARALAWRPWLAFFATFALADAALLWSLRGISPHPALAVAGVLLLYMSVSCTFCPLPTAWIVLWAAREIGALPVALVATLGTCIANLHDYYIVSGLCRVGPVERARQSALYGRAVSWFRRAPFLTLSVASFAPIPVDFVRLLAISDRYPRRSYVLATFAGRLPRYLLLAVLGHELQPSNRTIAAVLVAVALLGLGKAALRLARSRRADGERRARP